MNDAKECIRAGETASLAGFRVELILQSKREFQAKLEQFHCARSFKKQAFTAAGRKSVGGYVYAPGAVFASRVAPRAQWRPK